MAKLIPISEGQNQLRQNRILLLSVGSISTVAGLLFWSATPFLLPSKTDRLQIALRYVSLVSTMFCGITACVAGQQLKRISPLVKALEKAEQNDFMTQVASSQYVQEEAWMELATAEIASLQQQQQHETLPAVAPAVAPAGYQLPIPENREAPSPESFYTLYQAVMKLKQKGVPEKEIIEDILQPKGGRFAEGKVMLEMLMGLGSDYKW